MFDARIGRWFSPDPITHSWQSPYTSMDNNPVALNDVLGLSAKGDDDKKGKKIKSLFGDEERNIPDAKKGGLRRFIKKVGQTVRNIVSAVGSAAKAIKPHVNNVLESVADAKMDASDKLFSTSNSTSSGRLSSSTSPSSSPSLNDDDGWLPLTKSVLKNYVKSNNMCPTCGDSDAKWENYMGAFFENLVEWYWRSHTPINFNFRRPMVNEIFPSQFGNTKPDFIMDSFKSDGERLRNFNFIECKAKNGNLYMSSNSYQVARQLSAMIRMHHRYVGANYHPTFIFATTYGVKVSFKIGAEAYATGIGFLHYVSFYKMDE